MAVLSKNITPKMKMKNDFSLSIAQERISITGAL